MNTGIDGAGSPRRVRHRVVRSKGYFVIRAEKNMDFTVCESRKVDKAIGLRCDPTITLAGANAAADCPNRLRLA